MKLFPTLLAGIAVIALSACGNSNDQNLTASGAIASQKVAEIQKALAEAEVARKAVMTADSKKQLALQKAEAEQQAVKDAIVNATKELERVKQIALAHEKIALQERQRATAAQESLLQAAQAKAEAEKVLQARARDLEEAMARVKEQEQVAQKAKQESSDYNLMVADILSAESLASLPVEPIEHMETALVATTDSENRPTKAAPALSKPATMSKTQAPQPASQPASTAAITKPVAKDEIRLAAATRGHDLAQKCTSCHSIEQGEKAKSGPNLFGIVGQQAGSIEGYHYSKALAAAEFKWDENSLAEWICNSGKAIKRLTGDEAARTKMAAMNVCGQDANDIAAYLGTLTASTIMTSKAD